MTDSGPTLFWHRRDLRTVDNRGLDAASEHGQVIPVAVVDSAVKAYAGSARSGFYYASLASLQQTYRALGTDLEIRQGDPRTVLPELAAETDAERLVWNRDYSKLAKTRDEAVRGRLPEAVSALEISDMTLHEPGSILTSAGDHYSVFSYYYKKWIDRAAPAPAPQPSPDVFVNRQAPDVGEIQASPADNLPLPAGRQAARDRMTAFLDGPIYDYADTRDRPAAAGTSRLSQDLAFGLLGIRELRSAVDEADTAAPTETAMDSVEEYRRQLAWRDFYIQVLDAHPETVSENFKDFEHPIEWRADPEAFRAWTQGKTGYPIVDAGMRQLQAESFMHNRLRMIVASFLTKDLQLDWREGYAWFREQLLDHETANDVGGWQWAASTGTDAQPYFRIFNPMTQGKRHDPDAEYIKTYIPELQGVAPEAIHSWPDLDQDRREELAPDYPDPIVDHAERREETIEMFERARGG
ncbi:deoxyribodipyrimidine photo-lyase [Halodesulfurarchaeum formicicum]|uniref:Deoxyribodipyrimidine photo-lyase n=1 Tax=Halodesulfurarchaeum formicicum TaxID=1873524 RepID=A0A1D8S4J4_9EURY|nr:deoxyribodipyrimidine photo-lyase [Halodesulfurarchaeum formicicum]AOW80279.1 deoxyribodipyrimidine photo-lyase [Halodesulfurarchaeum formicicum]